MTTAEKRAQLKAEGEPWPDCECHGHPMSWNTDRNLTAGGRFRCRIQIRDWHNTMRRRRLEAAECIHCGDELATETMCRSCADAHADVMAQPKQRMLHQLANYRHKNRRKAEQGFRPSGVGIAAVQAVLEQATGEQ